MNIGISNPMNGQYSNASGKPPRASTRSESKNCIWQPPPVAVSKLEENHSATIIQKAYRRYQLRKKIKNITTEKIESQKEIQYAASISKTVREPLEDLTRHTDWISNDNPDLAAAQKAITQAAKLGSYDKFKLALRSAFSDTLQSIYASPPDQREYVMIADWEGKSTNWAIAHLHDLMSVHPPKEIIPRGKRELDTFLRQNPKIKHIVMVDDGTYSGEQASSYISSMEILEGHHKFHVAIPYMTAYGKDRIIQALQKRGYEYEMHDRQLMLSYEELANSGRIFSLTGKKIVNNLLISKIEDLPNEENSPIKISINKKLNELRALAKKKNNTQSLYEKILEMIVFIDSQRHVLGERGLGLMQLLYATIKPEYDQKRHQQLMEAYCKADPYTKISKTKTASWFAHKGADNCSCNHEGMKKIAGNITPVEPYKMDNGTIAKRKAQVSSIKKRMDNHLLEVTGLDQEDHSWLKDRMDFVHTNRGFFLLGNSYVEKTSAFHLNLHINGKMIKLGGDEGEYQYKLKKGDVFDLENPLTCTKTTLKLNETGKLEIIRTIRVSLITALYKNIVKQMQMVPKKSLRLVRYLKENII